MRRAAAALAGIVFGLLMTWLCLYTFSHMDWHTKHTILGECGDIEHCHKEWWTYPMLFGSLFAPALVFGLLNSIAWQRWTLRKWAVVFGLLTVATAAFYVAGYVL